MTAQACQLHPEQAAVGICVRCGAPFCDACLTKLDGINHCRRCLGLLAQTARLDAARAALGATHAAVGTNGGMEGGSKGEGDLRHGERSAGAVRLGTRAKHGLAWLGFSLSVALLAALAFSTLDAVLPAGAP